jgi:hypothetical protein
LINLLHLRVLIKANRVLIFDAYGSTDSYNQSAFIYDLEDKLRQKQNSPAAGGLPYEFRALESVLISVVSSLEKEFEGVREPVVTVLRELEEDIDRDKLRQLLIYSKKLGTFEQKAKLVRDAIDEILEADDDLAAMYLTEKNHDIMRGEDDHTEIEMLLESYHKLCDEIVQESGNLVSNIRNTEEMYVFILMPLYLLTFAQRQSYLGRQSQLSHAPRPQIFHWHPWNRLWGIRSSTLWHELKKLHRGIRPRFLECFRMVWSFRCYGLYVRLDEVKKGTASQHVG